MNNELTIEELYSESGSFDKTRAIRLLKNRVVFSENKEISFLEDLTKIKLKEVILLYAVIKKLLFVEGKIDTELFSLSDFCNTTGLNKSSIGTALKRLTDNKILQNKNHQYAIPTYKMNQVLSVLEKQ